MRIITGFRLKIAVFVSSVIACLPGILRSQLNEHEIIFLGLRCFVCIFQPFVDTFFIYRFILSPVSREKNQM